MIRLLILSVFIGVLNASTISLDYSHEKFEDFNVSYLQDKTSTLTINQIKNMKFQPISNSHGFYGKTGNVWYKIILQNTTVLNKDIYLHNNFAYYYRQTDVYEFVNGKVRDKEVYNILDSEDSNKLIGSTLVHKLTIPPNGTVTVYMKNIQMVTNLFDLKIYDEYNSINALANKDFYPIIIIAIMLTLALYNVMLYLFNRRKEFLFYALYMVTPAIGLNYMYGIIFSHFHLYGEGAYFLNLTAILMPGFLILFVKQVLHTKKLHKKIHFFLNILLVFIGADALIASAIDFTYAMVIFNFIFLLVAFVMIYLIIYLFKTSHPLATIFGFAYGFYFSGIIVTILAMSGVIDLNTFTFRASGVGLILEGLIFSYLMHYSVKILEKEIQEQQKIIISKNKKVQLGDLISAITHQWKQPLARIASVSTLMEFQQNNNQEISKKELRENISNINSNISFLSETIDDFKNFFNSEQEKVECDIASVIEKAVLLSKDDTLAKEITIETDLHIEKTMKLYPNELLHILLNLLQNAKEAFKQSDEKLKFIKVFAYTQDGFNYIDIVDNAGGIQESKLPFIFDEYYTTKATKTGSGLGLYLSKVILEDRLKGTIEVKSIDNGTMFRITL